eukprot:8133837-Alexandrium_andersonii.AAC.1
MLANAAIRLNPQSAMRKYTSLLEAFGAGTARAYERPRHVSPKLPRGAFCTSLSAQVLNLPVKH